MIKRNDIWAISLGAVQLALFGKLLSVIPSNVLTPSVKQIVLPPNAFNTVAPPPAGLQPLTIIRFIMMILALFFLFGNIGKISRMVSSKEELLNGMVSQVINASAGVLILILISTLFQGY